MAITVGWKWIDADGAGSIRPRTGRAAPVRLFRARLRSFAHVRDARAIGREIPRGGERRTTPAASAYHDVALVLPVVVLGLAVVQDLGVHAVREAHEEAPDAARDVDSLVVELAWTHGGGRG